jgi:hypothetical protein
MNVIANLLRRPFRIALDREPDRVIGGRERPYMLRWYLIPRNPFLNVYLHKFMRSDDDRALHDHPWANMSVLLSGSYTEHSIGQGGIHQRTIRRAGEWKLRWRGGLAHRVELHDGPCWTLFITGPRYRQWGFHCPERGWVHWRDFTAPDDAGAVGPGCDA